MCMKWRCMKQLLSLHNRIFHLETAPDILVIPEKLYNAVFWESLIFQAKFEDISGCIWSLLTAYEPCYVISNNVAFCQM